MKLHPPKLTIDEADPFKHALFGRKRFAHSLTNLLRHSEDNLVVFINASWGEGKTTFSEMWRAYLRSQKLEAIYYNAYANDYFEDPFLSFTCEILALVKKRLADKKGAPAQREELKKAAIQIGTRLVGLSVKVGLKAATLGALGADEMKELGEIGSEATTGASDIVSDAVAKRLEHPTMEKHTLDAFKTSLAKLAKLIREEQGFPLTIVIDELDRCRPAFALGLLERIKHLFDVENVAFVLLVNRDQIERYVQTVYGKNDESAAYLLKFGSVFVDLPADESQGGHYTNGSDEFCQSLVEHYELPSERYLPSLIKALANHLRLTLREIERLFTSLALYFATSSQQETPLGVMLAAIKIKFPELYRKLSRNEASYAEFAAATRWGQFSARERSDANLEYFQDCFTYLVADADTWQTVPEPRRSPVERYLKGWREKMLPRECAALDRFSFEPSE